jgi:prepilin-type N-terminal cleavage/methylation domain-containing protein
MHSRAEIHNQSGFSLIELLVAMAIMMIVLGAVFSLMGNSIKVSTATYEMTDAQQNQRTSQEFLNRDMVVVGDGLIGINNILIPPTFATDYLSTRSATNLNYLDPDGDGNLNLPIVMSDDSLPASTVIKGASPAANFQAGTDRITIMTLDRTFNAIDLGATAVLQVSSTNDNARVNVSAVDAARFTVGEIYYITNGTDATFATVSAINATATPPNIRFNNSDTYGLNAKWSTGRIRKVCGAGATGTVGTVPTSLMRMKIIQYFVTDTGLLIRRVFGVRGAGFIDSIIAEHVVDLEYRYVLDKRDASGNVVQPVTQLTTEAEHLAVRQVEVTITTETPHAITNNERKQITSTTRTGVRNIQFREALEP